MKPLSLLILALFIAAFSIAQKNYDVVINEVMADPSPEIGLPNNEWVELKNITKNPIRLQGWRLADASGQSGAFPNFTLQPDSVVIICGSAALTAMRAFGSSFGITSFPSLDNESDLIVLRNQFGKTIHAINYSSNWYQNELKKDGGWTLEMIDSNSPCVGNNNWKASINSSGGTPGKINSITGSTIDDSGPQLMNAYTKDSLTIILVFNEPLDSVSAATVNNYSIDAGLSFTQASALSPLFNLVQLTVSIPMQANKVYTINAKNITDCKGNLNAIANTAKIGLPVDAAIGDFVINEILFNPKQGAYDYVEVYNASTKIFDAAKLSMANRTSTGNIGSIKALSVQPFYIFPGDHIVATESSNSLSENYLVKNVDKVIELSTLPSFPDDEGTVLLLNFQGAVIDELHYSSKWHFKLIDNAEGVALEKINSKAITQNADNWHSAATSVGYGTPTYQNSQQLQHDAAIGKINVLPKVFSPDNDGRDDVAIIQYKMDAPGYVANVIIFDAAGRRIRHLIKNNTLVQEGKWVWDGLGETDQKLSIGSYIILTEVFNLSGKKQQFKNVIVLARMLQ